MQGLFPMTSLDDTLGGYLWRIPLEDTFGGEKQMVFYRLEAALRAWITLLPGLTMS